MPEELKTAQTNEEENNPSVDGNADANQQDPENENEAEFTDTSEQGGEQKPQPPKKEEPPQSREQNSENARRRREAERKQELKAAREQAIIDTLGGKNPFTGEEMKDSADVEEYLTMKEIETKGGDPLADFSKFHKAKEKERIAEQTRAETEKEWYRKDYDDFAAKHPEVDINTLLQDKQFQSFASGKVGTLPLSEIYEGFVGLVAEYEKKARQIAKQTLANSKASPGALSSPNGADSGFFTKEQVQKMTQEEVSKNYDKIRASMRKWK